MPLVHYDEAQYRLQIDELQIKEKTAFAVACAERLFPAYLEFANLMKQGKPDILRRVLTLLWDDLEGKPMSQQDVNAQLTAVMDLMPSDDADKWGPEQAAAEDAVAALAYALRCRDTGSADEAVWASRRAYEAVDQYVMQQETVTTNSNQDEEHILAHPLVQQELSRQQRDLDELAQRKVDIEQLRERSHREAESFLPWKGALQRDEA